MDKIARVLITKACRRHCDGCCNNYLSIMKDMKTIQSVDSLDDFDIVCLTGGEPMLVPELVKEVALELRARSIKGRQIYLYTAQFNPAIEELLTYLDGIHYTIHWPTTEQDIEEFRRYQDLIAHVPDKSYRLYIDSRVNLAVTIRPDLFVRVECKPWLAEEECPLPPGESLFYLRPKRLRHRHSKLPNQVVS